MAISLFTNRKGFFFTVIALLIVSVLFVSFVPKYGATLNYKIPSTESRVTVANDFVESLKTSYLPMALRMSSYNALNALSNYAKANRALFSGYDELNAKFAE